MVADPNDTYRLPTAEVSIGRMIVVPAIITFAVTLIRLVGEVMNWSPRLFNREAGGGGALIGIVWLVPVFAIYFALKLVHAGQGPRRAGAAIGWSVFAIVVFALAGVIGGAAHAGPLAFLSLFAVSSVAAVAVAWRGWPVLARVLFAYGLAARVPVAAVMLVAMLAGWGTHYEKGPPNFPAMSTVATWFWIGLVPQLTLWIAFTVAVGMLFGGLAAAVALRGSGTAAVPETTRA
jgi:hypothetical protein